MSPSGSKPIDVFKATHVSDPTFAMLCCAHGAEGLVKETIAADGWRLAFSRPGFVTAKKETESNLPSGTFIRTAARSLGQVRGDRSPELIDTLRQKISASPLAPSLASPPFDQLHVWPKDRLPIGRFGFEPGVDEVARAVADEIFQALAGELVRCDAPNRVAQPGESVLDVVLVDPSHWFIGTHAARQWPSRWPGGVQPIEPRDEPVSRAYFKAAEAIAWSGFPIQPGDTAVEIGSAPGGACGRLLELGLNVIGIDPAEMDPRIAEHPQFRQIAARAGDLPRREFRGAKWLLVDSNVRPDQTLVTVGQVVNHRESTIEGVLMTMKLGDYPHADRIPGWVAETQRWGATEVDVRQLARNRCEVCLAVRLEPAAAVNRPRKRPPPRPGRHSGDAPSRSPR